VLTPFSQATVATVSLPVTTGEHRYALLNGTASATLAQAVDAAQTSDVVMTLAFQARVFGPAMLRVNPNVKLFVYQNGEASKAADCSRFPASWYLYDAAGNKVKSKTTGNCAMYPLSNVAFDGYSGWADYVAQQCADHLRTAPLASGCYLDQLSSALDSGFATSLPVDPATGHVYDPATWLQQMGHIAAVVMNYTQRPVIGNSYEGGGRYFNRPTQLLNSYGALGFMAEHFLNAHSWQWTSVSHWESNINMMLNSQAAGEDIFLEFRAPTAASAAAWRQYVTATYLIGDNGHSWLCFRVDQSLCWAGAAASGAPVSLGAPLTTAATAAGYQVSPGVFVRKFESGEAIVNLSGQTATLQLGATYQTSNGTKLSVLTVPDKTGAVLQAAS
jgi:Hypothetical glycosyl hydrolase family 15